MEKSLLPVGFYDLLSPYAAFRDEITYKISNIFEDFGYSKIDPPLMEFEDTLFAKGSDKMHSKSFRLVDPLSSKMMAIRADITLQMARIAVSRLSGEPKPLRISYLGDVYRTKSESLHAERRLTQSGIELFGVDSPTADAEIIAVAVNALKQVGIKDICIDISIPSLNAEVLRGINIKPELKENLIYAMNKKDTALIREIAGKNSDILEELVGFCGNSTKELRKLKLPKNIQDLLIRVDDVVKLLQDYDIQISIDPVESLKFSYHDGIGFSIFSKNASTELGRGGRYTIKSNVESLSAVGATLYINEIFRTINPQNVKDKVLVVGDMLSKEVAKLIKDGLVIINYLNDGRSPQQHAAHLSCKYIYQNNKLKEIK